MLIYKSQIPITDATEKRIVAVRKELKDIKQNMAMIWHINKVEGSWKLLMML